jgi:hypothetical protein
VRPRNPAGFEAGNSVFRDAAAVREFSLASFNRFRKLRRSSDEHVAELGDTRKINAARTRQIPKYLNPRVGHYSIETLNF